MRSERLQGNWLVPHPASWREAQWATALGVALIALALWSVLFLAVVGLPTAPQGVVARLAARAVGGGSSTAKAAEPPDQVDTEGVE